MNSATDPWMITPRERLKHQEQFKSLQPQGGIVTGTQAKGFFLQSQLPPITLGQIWALADTDSDGKMNINEFSIACKLINLKLRGFEIPKTLPPTLLASLSSAGSTPTLTPTGGMSPIDPLKPPGGVVLPNMPQIIPQQVIRPIPQGIIPPLHNSSMITASNTVGQSIPLMTAQQINPLNQIPMTNVPIIAPNQQAIVMQQNVMPLTQATNITSPTGVVGSNISVPTTPQVIPTNSKTKMEKTHSIETPQTNWAIKGPAKLKYTQLFNTTDRTRSGYLSGDQARNIMVQSKLPKSILAQIWGLSDIDADGRLSCEEFILAMYLCDRALAGDKLPVTLPPELIPPTFKTTISRRSSVSNSRHGSISSSRHASISSQGAVEPDPLAGLPQTSFEDKRKENYDKGQAELDRRRKVLMDQQRKEHEERERKEREESEKRERARLEAERKQQEELERQLQIQREIEQEKEEQRKRALEAKEAARKELEKQRQLEWEKQRIQEMQLQRQREQEKVLKLKAQNQTLNIELSTLNEKIRELSQRICDTRGGVTNVKTFIDGMRSTRDQQASEMSQLKARIKEQNHKLLQLTQEKAKWDAKTKSIQATDSTNQEIMNATFSNKQIVIKQLKDKIVDIKENIKLKKDDIDSHDIQLTDIKAELEDLIIKCEELYATYDIHRNQVLEIKNNKKNESYNSAWDTAANTWPVDNPNDKFSSQIIRNDTVEQTTGYTKYVAIYEFFARNADEITFQPGDVILVPLEQNAEPGWLAGEINGQTGWFPETYVQKMESSDFTTNLTSSNIEDKFSDNNHKLENQEDIPAQPESNVIPTAINENTSYNDENGSYYIATYPYQSSEIDDLNFDAGEIILVTKKDGDWWTGVIGSRTGIFPSNYVQKSETGTAITENTIDKIQTNFKSGDLNDQNLELSKVTEELKTQEDLDTEVSQINKQQENDEHIQETFSRPMSRTSSMTPGMRAKKPEIAQVIAPYESTSSEQLSLQRGQLIMIKKKTDSGWWEGELQAKGRRRQIGWFPASYVKILQGGRNSGRNTPVSGSRIEMTETVLDKVIALFPYKAQNDDELSFEKDDIISVLGRDEPEWWKGELNGLTGLFPSNYVGPFVSSGNV